MHINDSLCPPPCNGGWGRGEVPPPSCREREVNVYQSYCQMPCGHGVGNGGVYSPCFSGIGLPLPSHHGGARGLEALELR